MREIEKEKSLKENMIKDTSHKIINRKYKN